MPLHLQIDVEPAPFEQGRAPARDRETWEVDPAPEPPAAQGHAAEQG